MVTETAQAAEPREGERYTRDGWTCVVHFVSHGHVCGHKHRAGEHDPPLNPHSLERLVRPNRFRISLPEWYAATAGATKEAAA